jgi:hypothetical protein
VKLADFNRRVLIVFLALDGSGIGGAAIKSDGVEAAVATHRGVQEAPGSRFVSL